jgi:hypothetical protein
MDGDEGEGRSVGNGNEDQGSYCSFKQGNQSWFKEVFFGHSVEFSFFS